jgi:undecaprenyl-diphosphatase
MTEWQALFLGALQGLTEFLPISSSGHLTLAQALIGLGEPDIFFDVVLHVGTLLAVLTYYRRDLLHIAADLVAPRIPGTGFFASDNWSGRPGRYLALMIVAGSIPTAVIGLAFKDFFESAFSSLFMVGAMLLVTALLLVGTLYTRKHADKPLSLWKALVIGTTQALAILPGLSRSGTTIATAFYLKIKPAEAARYSFLLSVPAIGGALLLKLKDMSLKHLDLGLLAIGFVTSAVVGYLALWLLIKLVTRGQLHWFALWCVFVAMLAFLKAV